MVTLVSGSHMVGCSTEQHSFGSKAHASLSRQTPMVSGVRDRGPKMAGGPFGSPSILPQHGLTSKPAI